MPVVTNVVINDGAASPVAHTFSPIGKDSKGVHWFEQTTPTPANALVAKRIGYRQTRPIRDARGQLTTAGKAIYTIAIPTAQTLGTNDAGILPPPSLAYQTAVRIEFDLPERSAGQERKDLRVLALNLLLQAMAIANIDMLQPTYGA